MNRRRFIGALGAAGALLAAGGFGLEPRRLAVTRHHLGSSPAAGDARPLVFAQITDLHLRSIHALHRHLAQRVADVRPDFIVLTGDSVDRAGALPLLDSFLSLLDPRVPKYAIAGNWEHWSGVDLGELAAVYARHGGRLLINQTVLHEQREGAVALTGLDDLVAGRPDLAAALAGAATAPAHLLLAHCPAHRDRLAADAARPPLFEGDSSRLTPPPVRFTAMLSGHTHGGPVNLFGWAPVLPPGSGRYVRGWFRDAAGPPLYVSRGIGTTVMPVRLGSVPELAVFSLSS